jgi:hypothetical protein
LSNRFQNEAFVATDGVARSQPWWTLAGANLMRTAARSGCQRFIDVLGSNVRMYIWLPSRHEKARLDWLDETLEMRRKAAESRYIPIR